MKLFTPIKFRNLEIKNRVVMAPMCMYSAENGVVPGTITSLLNYPSKTVCCF